MQHTKIIIKKLSASLFGKEQGEGSSLNTNGSTSCFDDSNDSSDGFQASESSCSPQLQPAKDAAASAASAPQQPRVAQQQQQQQRAGVPASGAGRSSFFFARVPPTITQEQLVELFSKYGAVEDLNLFRPFAEAKTSKGCGIVRFSSAAAAATAKSVLHGKFKWTDTAPPMVVEWVNEDKMRSTCCKAGSNQVVLEPKSRIAPSEQSLHYAGLSVSMRMSLIFAAAAAAVAATGSNEVVLEPKSETARSKQHSQSSTVQSSTMHSSGGNDSSVSSSSAQHIGDLTLASMLSSGTGHAMDIGSSMGSDQVLLRQSGGGSRHSGSQVQSLQQLLMKQQQQQQMMMMRQQPPPPPRAGYSGNSGSSNVQQQRQQLQQGAAVAAAAAAMAARQGVLAGAQRTPHQHNSGFNSDPLPDISAAMAAAAAAQQQQQQQQDIVQAEMQAATNSAAQFAAQQQQQQQQQQQVYVMMMGYAQQQQQMQQQLQQQCQDHAMAMAAGLDPAAQQQVLKQSGSFNAGLSGFCLMDTSSMSGLQQDCMQNNSNVSHPSLALNAAGALGSAADGGLDCYNCYNGLMMHARNNALSGSCAVLPPPPQQPCDSLAAAAAAAGITSGAGSRTPWRQVSMSTDGTYGSAAAAAAAAKAATVAAAASASGLARSGYGNAVTESQQQLLQRQIMSAGCNVLSGGNNMSFSGPVSGSCLPNGPAAFRKQPPPQQQQQAMHYEEQWMSGCGVGGYFDLQPSSSHNSGSFHAGLGQAGLSAGQAAGPSSAQQHAAVMAGASGGLPNLRAISDSCMMAGDGFGAQRQQQQLLQQLQQGMAARRNLHGSNPATNYHQQQQQQLNILAARPPSSAVSGSCLPSSPHDGDAMAAAAAAAAAVSGSFAMAEAADGTADGLSAQLNAINLASAGLNTPAAAAAAAAAGVTSDGSGDRVSVAVASGAPVVQALALHLDSITNLSGAEVQIRSDAGTLMVWLTGSAQQVQTAHNIVNLLLSQQLQQQ
uniref:RRM domain-containing protein n=1 Tax=Tetradesmus obliquus TaxID=3088 RepID=A0A383WI30_TETOB|eukprot:jgi/Sobl393_1/8056/SZX77118.1